MIFGRFVLPEIVLQNYTKRCLENITIKCHFGESTETVQSSNFSKQMSNKELFYNKIIIQLA